jgi:transposase
MGGSSLSFACASWTETLGDWIDAHARAFAYFGGAARLIVPDNPKTAVIRASLYDPQINRTYAEMAAHYDTAVLPARPRRPRDKAKGEAAVRIVERWLLGALRHRRFTPPSPSCWSSSTSGASFVTSAAPAASCSRRSTPRS